MVNIKINGISIEMPYKPYPSQIITISKLLTSFQNSTSALIESPTGTGKSFSIICSILAYHNSIKHSHKEGKPYKIFICSRTHSQINQLVEQLRKTVYRPKMTILGSKTHYSINSSISASADKNTACLDLIKLGKCVYFNGKDKLTKKAADIIFDIEELRTLGRRCVGCPYFASRAMVEDADLVFAPYNYLIDSKIRESLDISLENAIVIIDEAHNIEDVCRTAGSLELTSRVVDILSNELLASIKMSASLGEIKFEFTKIFNLFMRLSKCAEKMECDSNGYGTKMRIKKGNEIIEEFRSLKITIEDIKEMGRALGRIQCDENAKGFLSLNSTRLIEEVVGVFEIIEGGADSYAYCFQKTNSEADRYSYGKADPEMPRYVYNLWLLDPGVIFLPVLSVARSVCLLSGTLTPFQTFDSELKYSFAQQVSAPHILRKEQVFIANIKRGHLNEELCGTYNIAESESYLIQVAKIIEDVSRTLDGNGGVLVFVPSYAFLDKISGRVKNSIVEPRSGNAKFANAIKNYQERIQSRKKAILFCVYRGKASEGINFQDEYARAVIAIGIPFPSIKDPQIALKKEYNDKNGGAFNGRMWYEAQAFRAINQAVGRVIRHAKDWGAVFLLDSRFSERRNQMLLSNWVSSNLKSYANNKESMEFFNKFIIKNIKEKD